MSCYSESIGQFLPGLEERLLQRYRAWCCLNHVNGDSLTLAHFFSLFLLKTLLPTFHIRSELGFLSSYMLLLFFSMLCTLLPPHQPTFFRSASMNLCFQFSFNKWGKSHQLSSFSSLLDLQHSLLLQQFLFVFLFQSLVSYFVIAHVACVVNFTE